MGTITGIADLDPVRWPKSHWRSLKVCDRLCYLIISKIILIAEYNLQLLRCNFVFESFLICVSSSSLLVTLFLAFQCCEMFSQVNWDESTAGERQKRVSLWEIEPLTTPLLLCPSPFTMRSKRSRGIPGKWRLSRL